MEFQVPQFIEVEDKIFGPLTFKQFIYLGGGGGLSAVLVLYLPLLVAIVLCIPVISLSVALAFYKVNGKPFIEMLEAGFNYYIGRRLYLWKKDHQTSAMPTKSSAMIEKAPPQKLGLSSGKLEALALSLDRKEETES